MSGRTRQRRTRRLAPAPRYRSPGCRAAEATATRPRTAFTLVEVLATLLLMAIVLPAVMQGVSLATRAASVAQRRTAAGALAESRLAELVATNNWQAGALAGDFLDYGDQFSDYRWSAELRNWTEPEVQELHLTVTWTGAGNVERGVTLSTLVNVNAQAGGTTTSGGTSGGTSGTTPGGGTR